MDKADIEAIYGHRPWHYRVPQLFGPLCGADDDKDYVTTNRDHVDCPKCVELLKGIEPLERLIDPEGGMLA